MIRRLFRAEFIRFGIVGVVGLLVDIAVLYLCLDISGLGLYASRVVSYLAAATTTCCRCPEPGRQSPRSPRSAA